MSPDAKQLTSRRAVRPVQSRVAGLQEAPSDRSAVLHCGSDSNRTVLRDQDFPAAEACQRGVENGLQNVILGRSEPLVQHLHRQWDAALTG